jgi:hypothetical protein
MLKSYLSTFPIQKHYYKWFSRNHSGVALVIPSLTSIAAWVIALGTMFQLSFICIKIKIRDGITIVGVLILSAFTISSNLLGIPFYYFVTKT